MLALVLVRAGAIFPAEELVMGGVACPLFLFLFVFVVVVPEYGCQAQTVQVSSRFDLC